ncbi:hypothetical protein Pelo_15489 [Pelomyxa schiedti]|nr:hypothetical protein Pelo_15489 [Pelomyxa schiedti]
MADGRPVSGSGGATPTATTTATTMGEDVEGISLTPSVCSLIVARLPAQRQVLGRVSQVCRAFRIAVLADPRFSLLGQLFCISPEPLFTTIKNLSGTLRTVTVVATGEVAIIRKVPLALPPSSTAPSARDQAVAAYSWLRSYLSGPTPTTPPDTPYKKLLAFLNDDIINDMGTLQLINCPNVISGFRFYFHSELVELWIVMELFESKNVLHICGKLPPPQVAAVTREILKGLIYLEDIGFTTNLWLKVSHIQANISRKCIKISPSRNLIRLVDSYISPSDSSSVSVSSIWLPPELSESSCRAAPSANVWTLGMVVVELLLGTNEFIVLMNDQLENHPTEMVAFALELANKSHDPELALFVTECLVPVERRPTLRHLQHHRFITKSPDIDWALLGGSSS